MGTDMDMTYGGSLIPEENKQGKPSWKNYLKLTFEETTLIDAYVLLMFLVITEVTLWNL